jgi:hypothetical protein
MYRDAILDALASNVTMNDDQFVAFLHTLDADVVGKFAALQELMALVEENVVIMSHRIDGTGRTIGGVYSLPSSQQVARMKGR